MKKYTLGFVFNSTLDKVLLIHKLKPEWQAGMINGLGGKTDDGEDSLDCVTREIKEETNLGTQREKWLFVGNLHSSTFDTDVFAYAYEGSMDDAQSMEEQKVEWFNVDDLPPNVMSNLTWLVPISKEKIKDNTFKSFSAEYIINL